MIEVFLKTLYIGSILGPATVKSSMLLVKPSVSPIWWGYNKRLTHVGNPVAKSMLQHVVIRIVKYVND